MVKSLLLYIRSTLFQIYLFTLCLWATLLVGLASPFLPLSATAYCYRAWGLAVAWGMRTIVGMHIQIRGQDNIPTGKALFACKHQSMLETAILYAILDAPVLVMKKELTYIPLVGWMSRAMGSIVVDRRGGRGVTRDLVMQARERFREKRQILIFPEGTRSSIQGTDKPYRKGVYAIYQSLQDAPCYPIALNSGVFWPRHGFLRYPGHVIFEFLSPIPPGLTQDIFMSHLRTSIEQSSARLVMEGLSELRFQGMKGRTSSSGQQ